MSDRLKTLATSVVAGGLMALAFAVSPVQAADDGYGNVFSSLFSAFGIIKPDPGPDIAYRERPPLVLPPQLGLPKPALAPTRTAAWPKDPDVLRHKKDTDEARAPQNANDRTDQVSAAELARGRGLGEEYKPDNCNINRTNKACELVSPEELKAEGDRYSADNPKTSDEIVAGVEPARDYLTQPPKGYLKATRTVKATSEGPEIKEDPSDAKAYMRAKPKTDE